MIRKISGKGSRSAIKHIVTDNDTITDPKDIANKLADTLTKNSSSNNYTKKFKKHKNQKEKRHLKFNSNNTENYNNIFNMRELQYSLNKAHDTSAGPDDIHYQLLKHLPANSFATLLDIFNSIWESGNFPPSWREAIIIPIPKPGKDHTDPYNYRPIALTSCVCKTMERMINERPKWYLESKNIITEFQSGFRQHRRTTDHLISFETFIREAFIKKNI